MLSNMRNSSIKRTIVYDDLAQKANTRFAIGMDLVVWNRERFGIGEWVRLE